MKYDISWLRDVLVNICEFIEFVDKTLGKKKKKMRLCHSKMTSDGNPTFMIGDPMKKVQMEKTSH